MGYLRFGPDEHEAYGWVIDKDHVAFDDAPVGSYQNAPGVTGPADIPAEIEALLAAGKGRRFRLYDDDGELYYEGRWIGPGWDTVGLDETAFGPLDDFGTPNAGAVHIKYRTKPNNTGPWVEL